MKLSIKTDIFKEMVSRSIKGAGMDKLLSLTGMMAIELKDNALTLITTDASNYLYIKQENIVGDEFYVVVQVEQFSKLISKMTCETITMEVNDGVLEVKGNGTYKIELPMEEEGDMVVFPNPAAEIKNKKWKEVNIANIKTILNTIKPALAVTMEIPVYTRYYMGARVVGTDTYKVASLNKDVLQTEPLLISAETMNLLDVMTCEKIGFAQVDDVILFDSPDCFVYGHVAEGVEDFQIDAISALIEEEFKSSCKLDKVALLGILDRISLFVGQYDNKSITLTFTDKGVDVSSKTSTGVETLNYIESKGVEPFTCNIDIEMLTTQLKANKNESINLQFGNESSLKIVDGDITQIVALLME